MHDAAREMTERRRILTINTGSSSLKAALYEMGAEERCEITADGDEIGLADGHLRMHRGDGTVVHETREHFLDHASAIEAVLAWLQKHGFGDDLTAAGHRVVHGGSRYSEPQLITDEVLSEIQSLVVIDPDHLPQALAAIACVRRAFPRLPQIACFDTAFHRRMPRVAQIYPLPRRFADEGVVRYGFHGISYEYITWRLQQIDPIAANGRIIIAHLGNGASMAAVRGGESVDTTMGFSPTGGLMMGTRSGDLDPGVLLHLLRAEGLDPAALSALVNKNAGLLGVSGTTPDMRELLARASTDPHAAEAIALFCYQARKFLGALAAVLGGVDVLVFTGGIGERAPAIRRQICDGLEVFGIELDDVRNDASAPIISRDGSNAAVRVMATDEELMIARHTAAIIAGRDEHDASV